MTSAADSSLNPFNGKADAEDDIASHDGVEASENADIFASGGNGEAGEIDAPGGDEGAADAGDEGRDAQGLQHSLDPSYGRPDFSELSGEDLRTANAAHEGDFDHETDGLAPRKSYPYHSHGDHHEALDGEHDVDGGLGVLDLPDDGFAVLQQADDSHLEAADGGPGTIIEPGYADDETEAPMLPGAPDNSLVQGRPAEDQAIGALADAVQSALRNIYGQDANVSQAETLITQETRPLDLLRGGIGNTFEDTGNLDASLWNPGDGYERQDGRVSAAELDDSTTEAVLSYLYQNTAPSRGRDQDWRDQDSRKSLDMFRDMSRPPQFDDETFAGSFSSTGRGAGLPPADGNTDSAGGLHDHSYYRGGALRAPLQRPQIAEGLDKGLQKADRMQRGQPAGADELPDAARARQSESAIIAVETEERNGRLLGAAGLGLIGGIAIAGVLAVFLFNSFVTDPDQSGGGPLAVPGGASEPVASGSIAKTPSRLVSPLGSADAGASPFLRAADIDAQQGETFPLSVTLGGQEPAQDILVSLRGLPEGARLSAGIDAGGGAWLLPPQRLDGLKMSLAGAPAGSFTIEAQLLQPDARTPASKPARFTVNVNPAAGSDNISPDAVAQALAAMQRGDNAVNVKTEVKASPDAYVPSGVTAGALDEIRIKSQEMVREGNRLMRDGDILAARKLYQQAFDSGDPDGAMAMGRSFDPSYFEQIQAKTGTPDPAQAFDWYMKALDGGIETAKVKIDGLKQWLQR